MSFRRLLICLLLSLLTLTRSPLAADELPAWTSIGPDGGDVQALAVSPALPDRILAGVPHGYGVFTSNNRGRSWGPATATLGWSVRELAINSRGRVFYAAADRGLFRSTDGGATWPALDASLNVYSLVVAHPRQAGIVFAVRAGVLLRSTNGGITRIAVAGPQEVAEIAFVLDGQRTVAYAAANNGLWRSTDDGATWTSVRLPNLSSPNVRTVAVDPRNPRVVYAGLQHPRMVLLKSLDGGATWRLSQRGLAASGGAWPAVSEIAVDRANSFIVHAVAGGALFRSVNGGITWSRPVPELPGGFVRTLESVGYGMLAGTPAGVLLSTDRGLTWKLRTAGMTATLINSVDLDPQDPAGLYAATPGGLYKTSHRGRPWSLLKSFPTLSFGQLTVHSDDPSLLYALESGGFIRSTDGGQSWSKPTSFSCVSLLRLTVDPREPDHLFALGSLSGIPGCLEPYRCTFFRSLDAGVSWQCIGNAFDFYAGAVVAVEPFASILYTQSSFGSLLRSLDNGATWTHLAPLGSASSFAASPLVEGTLWAGHFGTVQRSRDGGQTWEAFSTGLPPGEYVIDLEPDPTEAATLYAATPRGGIFKSTDAGETWSPLGLWPADIPFNGELLVDPDDPSIVYAGSAGLGVLRFDQSEI